MNLHASSISATVLAITSIALVAAIACTGGPGRVRLDSVARHDFNRAAVRLNLPLFWVADDGEDGTVAPTEIASLLFYPGEWSWVEDGRFTVEFEEAYAKIVSEVQKPGGDESPLDETERERRRLVRQDLDNGIATLVRNDLSTLPDDHKTFVNHMLTAAGLIDQIYGRQIGAAALADQVPADDAASMSLFRRNWGPRGAAPGTELDPACSAIPGAPKRLVDPYPAAMQTDTDFCARLEDLPNAVDLLDPFTVVRELDDELIATPVPEAYPALMAATAGELRAAADVLVDPEEDALRAYLRAAAQSFTDNDWKPADEAWAAMNPNNSRWYLRIAPDEVYWEPCSQKAGFHLTFALINRDSLAWQDLLTPIRQAMEDRMAEIAGPPYVARQVSFHLPDFIDIVLNAGDDRTPLGATIGQSLPNWGPVANEGRGRTVAMTNLYTDADSAAIRRSQAESLFDLDTMAHYTDGPEPGLLGTILHEAAHNLGPAHEYEVEGRTDTEVFGGGLASTMEELKAQTAALWYLEFLQSEGLITEELFQQSYVDAMMWAFGHISRGMYTATGQRKAYSQLAAIQVGFLLESGALRFDPDGKTANGRDIGALSIDFERMPAAVEDMMVLVAGIKARGEREEAEALAKTMVDGEVVPQALISERILRHPKASFVYSIDL
jgi:hypothetical protein